MDGCGRTASGTAVESNAGAVAEQLSAMPWMACMPTTQEPAQANAGANSESVGVPVSYQCTPRIKAAKATCSDDGPCCFSSRTPLSPFAADESGNRRKAVFMTIS